MKLTALKASDSIAWQQHAHCSLHWVYLFLLRDRVLDCKVSTVILRRRLLRMAKKVESENGEIFLLKKNTMALGGVLTS